jgi:two-component system, OmpR family, sensor histidine kinase KdpD
VRERRRRLQDIIGGDVVHGCAVGCGPIKILCGLRAAAYNFRVSPAPLLSTGERRKRTYVPMTDAHPIPLLENRPRSALAGGVQSYAVALALVAASTLIGLRIAPRWGTAPVDMIYLPAVLAAAALWGIGPGLFAGIAAALAYNFFFTEPVHTFRMDRVADVVTVVVLLIVALVTSRLASGIRTQARLAAAHAERKATIAGFAGRLLSCSGEEALARSASVELRRMFHCNAMLVSGLPAPEIVAAVPTGNRLTPSDLAAAALCIETGAAAGRGTPRMQPAEWVFYPVRSADSVLAAVGLARDDGVAPVGDDQLPLLANLLDQLALALERARLESQAREFDALRERDRLRSALLSSIGHDLRPPVEAIAIGVRELRRAGSGDKELLSALGSEASRLDRYLSNLLELEPDGDQQPIRAGHVTIDLFQRGVSKDGKDVHLTPKEYAVLAELAKHPGRVLTHEHLLRVAWGPAQESQTEYLRVVVRSLRQKLERDSARPQLIVNEPAVGYRLAT